jgi:hypothetical protein
MYFRPFCRNGVAARTLSLPSVDFKGEAELGPFVLASRKGDVSARGATPSPGLLVSLVGCCDEIVEEQESHNNHRNDENCS